MLKGARFQTTQAFSYRHVAITGRMPVIENAIKTAAQMLEGDRSRGYCLEKICADFLAGANLEHGDRIPFDDEIL